MIDVHLGSITVHREAAARRFIEALIHAWRGETRWAEAALGVAVAHADIAKTLARLS